MPMTAAKAETIALFRAALDPLFRAALDPLVRRALVRRQAAMVPVNDVEPDDDDEGDGEDGR